MKKIYLVPATAIVKIKGERIMQNGSLTINKEKEVSSVDDLLSRESFSIWDDDEE